MSRLLPFSDVVTKEMPAGRLFRLTLFQVSVGMALVLLTGTLNRVMILELGVSAWLVALMVSLPLVFAPLRVLVGFRSDVHRSVIGWRRVPYIWIGTLLQFGGFAIMPFALLVLSGDTHGPVIYGHIGSALAFLLVGAGLHTTQTVGLALATDLSEPKNRPRMVALLFVMLLVGMLVSAILLGWLLNDFSQLRLIQVIQGAAVVTLFLNFISMWRQEPLDTKRTTGEVSISFSKAWRDLRADRRTRRLLIAVAFGTAGFAMQDVLLEPYGGQILGLSVSSTTLLTAVLASGMLCAFLVAAQRLHNGTDANRLAAYGALLGIVAFAMVTVVAALHSSLFFTLGVALIGFGGGLFAVGTLTAAMSISNEENTGLALGAWGAVQATASGIAIACGGALRDLVSKFAMRGDLGPALTDPATGYGFVYQIEILLLFATLIAIGPLAAFVGKKQKDGKAKFGLANFPS